MGTNAWGEYEALDSRVEVVPPAMLLGPNWRSWGDAVLSEQEKNPNSRAEGK